MISQALSAKVLQFSHEPRKSVCPRNTYVRLEYPRRQVQTAQVDFGDGKHGHNVLEPKILIVIVEQVVFASVTGAVRMKLEVVSRMKTHLQELGKRKRPGMR